MKSVIKLILIIIPSLNGFSQNKNDNLVETINVEFFVSARFDGFAGYDNGIYNYEFSNKSILYNRIYCGYKTRGTYDSVFKYFYKTILIPKDSIMHLIDSTVLNLSNELFYHPDRMILVIHNSNKTYDTLKIDDYRTLKMNNIVYGYKNHNLMTFILANLPPELRDNWSLTVDEAKRGVIKLEDYKKR